MSKGIARNTAAVQTMIDKDAVKELVTRTRAFHAGQPDPLDRGHGGPSTAWLEIRAVNLERDIESTKRDALDQNDGALALEALHAEVALRHARALLKEIEQMELEKPDEDSFKED